MPNKKQKRIPLTKQGWNRLKALVCTKIPERCTNEAVAKFLGCSPRKLGYVIHDKEVIEFMFGEWVTKLGFKDQDALLDFLNEGGVHSRRATPIPSTLDLKTERKYPQWADHRDYFLGPWQPWVLRCKIETKSPYFRFGFKLLGPDGRVFGDGSIKSGDENLLVHVGRNYWDRPALGIMAQDIFLTAYANGNHIEEEKSLFSSEASVVVSVELKVDRSYCARLTVNGDEVFETIVPPAICRRVVVYAWGDQDEFEVNVTDLAVTKSELSSLRG